MFKKKGKTSDSFYVANDKFQIAGNRVKLPKIGGVSMQETLRLPGKILGVRVTRQADQWVLSVQVDVPDIVYYRHRTGNGIEGADVGVKTFATLADGEKIAGPQAHRKALRRLKMRQRAMTRKMQAAKMSIGLTPKAPIPQGTRLPRIRNWLKAQGWLAHTHRRVFNIRSDFLHQTSARLCRENPAIGIETLSVEGMMQNHHVARAVADQGFGPFFTMLKYKAERYGTQLVEPIAGSPAANSARPRIAATSRRI